MCILHGQVFVMIFFNVVGTASHFCKQGNNDYLVLKCGIHTGYLVGEGVHGLQCNKIILDYFFGSACVGIMIK